MNQAESQANILKAQQLAAGLDLGQRHAIVAEHSREVTALAVAVIVAGSQGQVENVRLLCETVFALGYLAGKEDQVSPPDVFNQKD